MESFQAIIQKFDFNHWQYHLAVSDQIATKFIDRDHRRVLVWIDSLGPFHMALIKSKHYWYLMVNRQIREKLRLEEGSAVRVRLEKDESEFGLEMPEEFGVLMDQDEEDRMYFNRLTPGKQRSLIHLVVKVKNPESRMKKSLAIMHHLRLSKGKLDFKQLNELIKYYNNL
ncbi:YdeI/OmpD-associated family protein [Algoriphagus sp.]|uniref:YdeI/OmpD-associated family protein n=1 Tax=Algoriphagus sp. TaxID=1872435 RepID=UPI0026041DF5|nr:YdeI/OmpD-associated family protein [Algoriphagus sp.]